MGLLKVGWKKDFVNQSVPVLPISGWMGDNLINKSTKMDWWKGVDIKVDKEALEKMVRTPDRPTDKPMRTPISGVFKIKGVGDVLTGRVEQGQVKPGDEVVFLPTHTPSTACTGKVFTVEMHHKTVDAAKPGDNVGLNIKGLNKANMPRVGDVMVLKTDSSVNRVKNFTAQVQILNHPGELGREDGQDQLEDWQGDWRPEARGRPHAQGQRDGRDCHGAPAALCG